MAHRIALEREFDAQGWSVEWKGTVLSASYGSTNPCEGYSGQNAEDIARQYEAHATSVAADVLLLHAGHNYDVTSTPEADIVTVATNAHTQIIEAARAKNPNVVVLYAKVITSSLEKYAYIPALNDAIGVLGAELNTEASPVVVVDMADGWYPATDCVSDGVHPTEAGALKMAEKWMVAINEQSSAGNIKNLLYITSDAVLQNNSKYDLLVVAPNATLNLNGHKLMTGSISGGGTVVSAAFDDTPCAYGYDLLEYVQTPDENSGHVDTGYRPNCTDRVETNVSVGSTSDNEMIFSSRKSGSAGAGSAHFSCLKNKDRYFRFDRNEENNHAKSGTIAADTPYEIIADFGDRRYMINGGSPLSTSKGTGFFEAYTNIILFATGDKQTMPASSCKMYYFRVFDKDGNLKVNMLPASKDGAVGFFDTVRKRFFELSSGSLAAGGNISYESLTYAKTPDDNNSYVNNVDTGYMPLLTDRVETKIRLGNVSTMQGIFSARETSANNTFSCIVQSASDGLRFDHGTTSPYVHHRAAGADADTTYTTDKDYEIVMDGKTCVFSVNGDVSTTMLTANPTSAAASPGITFRLFTIATKNTNPGYYAKGCRMYYFRVTDTNGYQRLNLIPARRRLDDKVGFYDTVRNVFITKADGGSLEAGGVLALPRDLTTPSGTCAMVPSSVHQGTAENLFNDNFTYLLDANHRILVDKSKTALPIRIDYDFGEGNEVAVNLYRIYAGYNERSPKKWILYGSNESSSFNAENDDGWTPLDNRDSQTDWLHGSSRGNPGECRTKAFANDTPYRYYRLKVEKQNKESQNYLELVQIEYFRVEPTVNPGELHIVVADDEVVTNSDVRFGGDLKVVKEGTGDFIADAYGQFYTGGTDVKAGGFTLGTPLATCLTMDDDATLGFLFRDRNTAPLLTLDAASSIPSPLKVAICRNGTFRLTGDGVMLTCGYDFGGKMVNYIPSDYARRVSVDKKGNLVASNPNPLRIIFR